MNNVTILVNIFDDNVPYYPFYEYYRKTVFMHRSFSKNINIIMFAKLQGINQMVLSASLADLKKQCFTNMKISSKLLR